MVCVALDAQRRDGMVKCLPDAKEILRAHIAECDATEIIHEILLPKENDLLPKNIAQMIHVLIPLSPRRYLKSCVRRMGK
jgi:pyruvate/2-oxoglutarate dehydrogenase complex dihydrolipoamide dehydrogenase (E3) component